MRLYRPSAEAYDRGRGKLRELASEVGDRPLVLADLAFSLIGHANRCACDGAVTADEWVELLLDQACITVATVAGWREVSWRKVVRELVRRLDLQEFELQVRDDIWRLPE
jgi:hypothetical protein